MAASDIDAQLARDYIYEWIESEGQDIDSDEADQHLLTKACLRAYGIIFISSFCQGMIDPGIVWEEIEKQVCYVHSRNFCIDVITSV